MSSVRVVDIGGGITSENFADVAERRIKEGRPEEGSKGKFFDGLTTSKLRSIYAMIVNVQSRMDGPDAFEVIKPDLQYLKVRMAYEAGRERSVKVFLDKTGLMDAIGRVKDCEEFTLFCRYAESLVAYFKYYGGRD